MVNRIENSVLQIIDDILEGIDEPVKQYEQYNFCCFYIDKALIFEDCKVAIEVYGIQIIYYLISN